MAVVRGLCSVTGERIAEKATISHEKDGSDRVRRKSFGASLAPTGGGGSGWGGLNRPKLAPFGLVLSLRRPPRFRALSTLPNATNAVRSKVFSRLSRLPKLFALFSWKRFQVLKVLKILKRTSSLFFARRSARVPALLM